MNIEINKVSENQYNAYILESDVPAVTRFLTEEAGCTILNKGPGGKLLRFGPKYGSSKVESEHPIIYVEFSNPIGDEIVGKVSRKFNLQVLVRDDNRWTLVLN